jgi:hypothetical protein
MLKNILRLGCLFAALSTASTVQASDCGEVSIMQGDWGSAQIVTCGLEVPDGARLWLRSDDGSALEQPCAGIRIRDRRARYSY